ncbi:MAG TPA: glycolate oxidase subunit GlcF [Candidatus Acidoferrales bacterium]|nr:glycolate oxidase subunit GlcF [Candidatus Acidoferrales bacterium]
MGAVGESGRGTAPGTKSAFDAHHPPARELMDKCVHCGFCLPVCPTYVLWHEEMDSPRGRIYLMRLATDGAAEMNQKWVGHLDACLGCMACMTACPSGVDYGKLIEATRAQIERNYPRSAAERLYRRMIFATFTNPGRLRALLAPMRVYQGAGLQALARKMGILKLLPKRLRSMESLLPRLGKRETVAEVTPAQGTKRHRVGMLTGCVQSVIFPQVNAATARVLAAEGCEVVTPAGQRCCGALLVHAGEEEQALELARQTIDAFERAGVDAIIVNAAGCGSTMKEYGYLLRDDPAYAAKAREFAAKCQDVSEFLAGIEPRAPRNPLPVRVAYHDSCHLQHAQQIRTQPRMLLARIPQLEILEIAEAAVCCGSAGIYNLVQPEAAAELGDRKAANVAALKPDVVASGNPGCLLQLRTALERAGKSVPVLHTIELLDASIRGASL